jgi:hypothetical protein
MKKFYSIVLVLLILLLVGCSEPPVDKKVQSIEIYKDLALIDELDVFVKDEFTLTAVINDDIEAEVVWSTSDNNIISIDQNGKAVAKDSGTVIITVYVKDYPFVTDSIYVEATRRVEQLGVGSGKSKDDPIFLGNEGEDEPLEIYFIEMQHIYADSLFIKKGNVEILFMGGYD